MASSTSYGDPDTRARILRAAWAMVAERGEQTTIGDVAARASVSRQAVYLHFGDRSGLLVALVNHMDETLDLGESLAQVHAAADGVALVEAAMWLNTTFWAHVLPVAQVLEAAQHRDQDLGAAWRDRMRLRQATFRTMVQALDSRGELAQEWTVDEAAATMYAVAHFDTWRELVVELGWSDQQYVDAMSRLLRRSLVQGWSAPDHPPRPVDRRS
ncbi:MAG: TetR/AcrR family transcriptional regulator [Ornithinimicrobium sp.]